MPAERSQRFGNGSIPDARSCIRRCAVRRDRSRARRRPRLPAGRHPRPRQTRRSRAGSTADPVRSPCSARPRRTSSLRNRGSGRPSSRRRKNGTSTRLSRQRGQSRLDGIGSAVSEASIRSSSLGLLLKKKTSPRSSQTPLQLLQTSTRTPPLVIVSTSDGCWQCGQFMVQNLLDSALECGSYARGIAPASPGRLYLNKRFDGVCQVFARN